MFVGWVLLLVGWIFLVGLASFLVLLCSDLAHVEDTAGFDSSCTCYGSHLHGWEGEEVHLHRARNNSRFSVLVVVFNHIASSSVVSDWRVSQG